jgi:hypothetical protein
MGGTITRSPFRGGANLEVSFHEASSAYVALYRVHGSGLQLNCPPKKETTPKGGL